MKKRYQIEQQRAVQQFRRSAAEENPNVQMVLPLADIVDLLQQGVGNLLRETGLADAVGDGGRSEILGLVSGTSSTQTGGRIAGARRMATAL